VLWEAASHKKYCCWPKIKNFGSPKIFCPHTKFLAGCATDWDSWKLVGTWKALALSAVTCCEVRVWGGTVSFKGKFASIWIEWSSINSTLNWLLAEWLLLMLSIPYHHFYTHIGTETILGLKKGEIVTMAQLKWLITYLFIGFINKLKQSQNLCIRLQCIQWSNRECRPSAWLAAAESFNEICKLKVRVRAVLQISALTSAQQHTPMHFILLHLKLNRTGGSTHWRRKYNTWSTRSTKSYRLTTRIQCDHNKQLEVTRTMAQQG